MNEPVHGASVGDASGLDRQHMQRALGLAERGWGQTAPNPMVGAVVVSSDGTIAGEGFHARYGEAHAEVFALRAAAARARGATLYVTLEPCAHHGKTPPCVDAIVAAGIARVVIAVRDPSVVARGGTERLRAAGIRVDIGVECDAATELNAPFLFSAQGAERPWVILKLALSSDGAAADPTGVHRWITGPASRRQVHHLRANADAIAVGIGTVLADDPELTVRDVPAPRVAPSRIIFDSRLRTPPGSKLARSASETPTIFIASSTPPFPTALATELLGLGAEIMASPALRDSLAGLCPRGVRALFVEAGPRLAGAFLRESLVDRLTIFRSSLTLGDDAPRGFAFAPPGFEETLAGCRVVEERHFGEDIMTTYALRELPCSPD